MTFGYTPEGAATVIVVSKEYRPGVLVDEKVALGIDVTLIILYVALDFPDAVQLEARVIRVDMAGLGRLTPR